MTEQGTGQGPVTVKEYRELRAWFGAELQERSIEELRAHLEQSKALLARDQKHYDEAVRFRPAYAPAGRPTRSESSAAAAVQQGERVVRYVSTILACKLAGRALPQ